MSVIFLSRFLLNMQFNASSIRFIMIYCKFSVKNGHFIKVYKGKIYKDQRILSLYMSLT